MSKLRKSRILKPKRTILQRVREGLALLSLLGGTILFFSLVTYHFDDPSWSVSGTGKPYNILGAMGASLSDICLKFFGYHSYVLVLLAFWFALAMLLQRKFRLNLVALTGYGVFALLSAGLWHLWWGTIPGGYSSGGLWGQWLALQLTAKAGSLGASMLLVVGILLAAVWTTQFSISMLLLRTWHRLEPWTRARFLSIFERWLDWRDGFARWRWERQQKRKGWEQGEGQWAMADGVPSELPQLELESSWLRREHQWSEASHRRREENLPVLTPPELPAVEATPENACKVQDVDRENLPKEASFWEEEMATPSEAHSMDLPGEPNNQTRNIRCSNGESKGPLPNLTSNVLPQVESKPIPVQPSSEDLSQWGDALSLYDLDQSLTVPEVPAEELEELAFSRSQEGVTQNRNVEESPDETTIVEQKRDTHLAETAGPKPSSKQRHDLAVQDYAFSIASDPLGSSSSYMEVRMSQVEGEHALLESEESLPSFEEVEKTVEEHVLHPPVISGQAISHVVDSQSRASRKKGSKEQEPKERTLTVQVAAEATEAKVEDFGQTENKKGASLEKSTKKKKTRKVRGTKAQTKSQLSSSPSTSFLPVVEIQAVPESSPNLDAVEVESEKQKYAIELASRELEQISVELDRPSPESKVRADWQSLAPEQSGQEEASQASEELARSKEAVDSEALSLSEPRRSSDSVEVHYGDTSESSVPKENHQAEASKPQAEASKPQAEASKPKRKSKAKSKGSSTGKKRSAPAARKSTPSRPVVTNKRSSKTSMASNPASMELHSATESDSLELPMLSQDSLEVVISGREEVASQKSAPSVDSLGAVPASTKQKKASASPATSGAQKLLERALEEKREQSIPRNEPHLSAQPKNPKQGALAQVPSNSQHSGVVQEPAAAEVLGEIQQAVAAQEPVLAQQAAEVRQPVIAQAPVVAVAEEPARAQALAHSEESVASEAPAEPAQKVAGPQPVSAQEPAVAPKAAVNASKPVAVEQKISIHEPSVAPQATVAPKAATAEEPATAEGPATAEEPETAKEEVKEAVESSPAKGSEKSQPASVNREEEAPYEGPMPNAFDQEHDDLPSLDEMMEGMRPLAVAPDQSIPSSVGGPVVRAKVKAKDHIEIKPKEKPAWKINGYEPPSLDLLDYAPPTEAELIPEHLIENARTLERTLENFNVRGEVKEILPGPVITIYEYLPEPGIKVSKIAGLADDLAMALHAMQVRVIAPIPGKGVVGIEIPNKNRETVYLKEILADENFMETEAKLPIAIGKNTTGSPYVANLAKMPHLLIAGTTGSGKSVGVNGMICSLLFNCSPKDVRFLMIDPKMLELSIYEGIPHLLLPVVTEPKKAAVALNWAVSEMERRYRLMAEAGVRNIGNYNKLIGKRCKLRDQNRAVEEAADARNRALHQDPENFDWEEESEEFDLHALMPNDPSKDFYESLPYIVVVIDELADLMMVAAKEVEFSIARLAQMARAAGIHLLLATQRPSVDVLTGVIKANFPSRMAFQVKSKIDSRTILDQPGADRLLGAGDLLLMPPTSSVPIRLHGAFISEEEIHRIVKHLKKQGEPEYNDAILVDNSAGNDDDDMPVDAMYDKAVDIVLRTRNASISFLQRKLRIGYNRSARIVEMMEREGLISAQVGNRPREVLVPPPQD